MDTTIYRDDELMHYGVLGMKWGVRRYQNIDGTLTEAGKDHRAKYIAREKRRLNKMYDKYKKKYTKKAAQAEANGDMKTKKYYLKRLKDAEKSRKRTNDYISKMTWEQIKADEAQDFQDLKKVAKVAGIAGLGLAGAGTAAAVATGAITAPMVQQKIEQVSATPQFQAGKQWVDLGVNTYVGARSYVMGASINAVMNRIDTDRVNEISGAIGRGAGEAAKTAVREFNTSSAGSAKVLGTSAANYANQAAQSFGTNLDPEYVRVIANAGEEYYRNKTQN